MIALCWQMLFATMHNARKRVEVSGVTEKMRQQHKARPQKTKDIGTTFKQHCSSLQSTVGPLKQEEGFEHFRRCISDGVAPVKKEAGFEQYRRSLSVEWPLENKESFKEYRRSLSIPGIGIEGSTDVNRNGKDVVREPLQERCTSECMKPQFKTCVSGLSQASTAAGTCEEDDDEGDFSQANTTAGEFADEGPFDFVRLSLP